MKYLPKEIDHFIQKIPELLALHAETADLAIHIEQMDLPAQFQYKFTLAVVGQMKAGKSTLLNALLEKDSAPVGVNECTATVNRFLFSKQPSAAENFRVHWKNGTTEDRPVTKISSWIGRGENVEQTARLDFFSNASFLQDVNIVDTPGLRSIIDIHEQNVLSILKEQVTVKEGSQADAIVYVLNPVGKQNDQRILDLFGENTRLPGINAYNSIAVVQKWEQSWMDLDTDIMEEVYRKCETLKKQLEGKVSEVIPVSGLLARCLYWLTDDLWWQIIKLGRSPSEAIRELTFGEDFFLEDQIESATMNAAERKLFHQEFLEKLKKHINLKAAKATWWPIVSFLLKFTHKEQIKQVEDLKKMTWDLSGIDQLKAILQERFFQRTAIIKAGTILRRAWEPCEVGIARLDQLSATRKRVIQDGEEIIAMLGEKAQKDVDLNPALTYIKENIGALEDNLKNLTADKQELYRVKSKVQRFFRGFDNDITAIELLEKYLDLDLTQEEKKELKALFGVSGVNAFPRLQATSESLTPEDLYDKAQNRLTFWALKERKALGITEKICGLAQTRLKDILDDLEGR